MKKIEAGFNQAYNLLGTFIADEKNFVQMEKAGLSMVESIKKGGKIFSCGNGGSMADAMHFAEELTGRFRDERPSIPAIAIADSSHITCTANDYGFECIFSRYLEGLAREGDVLLAISTSGNSANIVKAAETALKLGMKVVALTGKTGGKLGQMDVIEIRVPFMGYADRVQEIHIKIIHNLIDFIERNM